MSEPKNADILSFYQGRKILVTGHTGFKGSWLCAILHRLGAKVTGFALQNESEPNLYALAHIDSKVNSYIGDIRNLEHLQEVFYQSQPEIVFHLAAQPIVRLSYQDPVATYTTNVLGTVNLLECVRQQNSVKSVINITTDKVYFNQEWDWGYRETDKLDGFDPYSNSKSCSELVSACFARSFFEHNNIALSTLRAGNVIGGGDFAVDRIIPDCVRCAVLKQPICVRNPDSIRPYQHVLEPLLVYLKIAQLQFVTPKFASTYNVGPNENDYITTGQLAQLFCDNWGEGLIWQHHEDMHKVHESKILRLDCSKLKSQLQWHPCWNVQEAVKHSVSWYKVWQNKGDLSQEMDRQIALYFNAVGL